MAAINIINPYFQSPLRTGGKKPKKKTVQENPTGAFFVTSKVGCLKFIVVNAKMFSLLLRYEILSTLGRFKKYVNNSSIFVTELNLYI
jgi:hypothetical protein